MAEKSDPKPKTDNASGRPRREPILIALVLLCIAAVVAAIIGGIYYTDQPEIPQDLVQEDIRNASACRITLLRVVPNPKQPGTTVELPVSMATVSENYQLTRIADALEYAGQEYPEDTRVPALEIFQVEVMHGRQTVPLLRLFVYCREPGERQTPTAITYTGMEMEPMLLPCKASLKRALFAALSRHGRPVRTRPARTPATRPSTRSLTSRPATTAPGPAAGIGG